jgi:hypothetical protein
MARQKQPQNRSASLPLTDRERAYFGSRANKVPGSVDWCWQTILLMQRRWQQKYLDRIGIFIFCD